MLRQMLYIGVPLPRLTKRKLTIAVLMLSFSVILLLTALHSHLPSSPSLSGPAQQTTLKPSKQSSSESAQRPVIVAPKTSFRSPPRQKDDTYGNSSWLVHPDWLSEPFSEQITLDKDRALLPSLQLRQPIYCYYDPLNTIGAGENDTDTELLLMWRRSWWARGFKPFILGPEEARTNSLYPKLESMQMDSELKSDLLRWLAFDTTDGGLLSHHMLFPMGPEHDLLPSLRRGEYSALSRAANTAEGLFWGTKEQIRQGMSLAFASDRLVSAKSILDVLDFAQEETTPALAFYNATIIEKKYPKLVSDKNKASFGQLRNQLINAHLQASWQNIFSRGIDVVKPFPEHMSAMVGGAKDLAEALVACPPTPLAGSCPPNIPKCGPCGATTPLVVRTPNKFENKTNVFTIGVVPHPWTRTVLANMNDGFNATYIRGTERDAWLSTVTQSFISAGVSRYRRLVEFKKMVAGGSYDARSLWFVAEDPFPPQLDWHFGFAIPKTVIDDGHSESPVPSDHIHDKDRPDLVRGLRADERELEKENVLLNGARVVIVLPGADTPNTRRRCASLEAWNMADTEAWKVTRAAFDRRTLERKFWEQESKYTQRQRLLSEDAWKPGTTVSQNTRKQQTKISKQRD